MRHIIPEVVRAALWRLNALLLPRRTEEHVLALRSHELAAALRLLRSGPHLLEIGAGNGWQARLLSNHGFKVSAVDVQRRACEYHEVRQYDGKHLPFDDQTFDIVFSSNVLEHVAEAAAFQREVIRVLRPGGRAVHVVPTAAWRFWTNVTHPIRYFRPPQVHGEHAANTFAEFAEFRERQWTRFFERNGWQVLDIVPTRIFYTGSSLADRWLPLAMRRALSFMLGSSCKIYVLELRTGSSPGTGTGA